MKDVWKLKKNAWYCRLMKYTWNFDYDDFHSICPFFWLTIFNIILFPILFPFKSIIYRPLRWMANRMGDYFDERYSRWSNEYYQTLLNNPKELENFVVRLNQNWDGKLAKFYFQRIHLERWCKEQCFKNNRERFHLYQSCDRILHRLQQIEARRHQQEQGARLEIMKRKKQKINRLLRVIKPVLTGFFYLFAFGVLLCVGFGIYIFIRFLIALKHKDWMNILIAVAVLISVAGLITSLVLLIKRMGKEMRVSDEVKVVKIKRRVNTPFRATGDVFLFIKQLFANNCPAIEWDD